MIHDIPSRRSLARLFIEPRCYTFVGTAVAVAGLGIGAASAAGAFSPTINEPNTAQEAEQMQQLQAQYLPAILGEEAAQEEGGTYTLPPDIAQALQQAGISIPQATLSPEQQTQLGTLQSQLASLQQQIQNVPSFQGGHNPGESQQYQQLSSQIANTKNQIQALQNGGGSTLNFAGQGTASTEGQIEQQLAQGQLQEGEQYDPAFIQQALAEEQQADPQEYAARQAMYQQIQNEINNPQSSPVAQTMENQIQEKVNAGSGLTPEEQQMLNASVTASNASGLADGGSGSPDFSNLLTTGYGGEQRALQNAGSGATELASGETPADIAYREQQQNIGNLSSFSNNITPEAQFSQLSGAATSPTPDYQSGYLPSYNGTAAASEGATGAATQYGQQVTEDLGQANPWTAGLSTVLSGVNSLEGAGAF